jgi:lysyl endopeptidase
MKPILLLTVLLALFSQLANGQVKTNFNNAEMMTSKGKFRKNFQAKSPRIIPAKDIKSLLEKEATEGNLGEAKPFKIAEAVKVDIDIVKEAAWIEEAGFAHGKYTIVANGAKSISANFDRFKLPKGTELYVYSANGEMITGPVTENENNERNFWGTWVYKGGSLTVDFKTPIETKSELKLHISSVAYGYKDIYRSEVNNFGESSPCNINVLCPLGNGWENERNSVSLILNGNSTALCSGALINNTCNLNIPYLLTANHCFEFNPDVANWKFTFQAWSPICDRLQQQNANGITFNGSTLRARNANSDFCLVELTQLPPANSGITFSGWSRNTVGIQNTTIIHHPAGDVMKISRDDQAPVFTTFLGSQEWQLVLDQGATNGGSSGAPYYDQNHRIIAQHHGINQNNVDQCLNTNKFGGRFDISWTGGGTNATRLSNWLDPNNTQALTTDTRGIGINGPALVCTTANYTFVGPVTWTSSNPNGLSINATGTATRQNNFNGQVTVTATIGGACGNLILSKPVQVGVFNQSTAIVTGTSGVCPGNWYTYTANVTGGHQAGYSYQWSKPSSWTLQYQSNNSITYSVPFAFGGGTLGVSVNNGCGSSSPPSTITVYDGFGCYPHLFSVSPNPATDVVTVMLATEGTQNLRPEATLQNIAPEYNVELISDSGQKVLAQISADGIVTLDTKSLLRGIYVLRIFHLGKMTTKRVMLK